MLQKSGIEWTMGAYGVIGVPDIHSRSYLSQS
jgi:hypothetical protein